MTLPPLKYSWLMFPVAAIVALAVIALVTFGIGHHAPPKSAPVHYLPAPHAKKIVAKPIAVSYSVAQEKKHVDKASHRVVRLVDRHVLGSKKPKTVHLATSMHRCKHSVLKHHSKKHHHKVPSHGHHHHHQSAGHQAPHHAPSYPSCGYQGFSCGP